MPREKKNRILYLDTSLRNPERIKTFLSFLVEYKDKILTEELAKEVEKKLIMNGLYRPNLNTHFPEYKDQEEFTEDEAKKIMEVFTQDHGGGGMYGWGTRFTTHYHNMQQLGYCLFKLNEKIKISDTGIKLVQLNDEERSKISMLHLNAVAHWQTSNPLMNNANNNKHLSLLLKVIKLSLAETSKGILPREIPIILCWKNNNSEELFHYIKDYRNRIDEILNQNISSFKINDEIDITTLKYCSNIFGDKWTGIDKDKKIKLSGTKTKTTTILKDYPDTYFRYMKETTLIYKKKVSGKSYIWYDEDQIDLINYIIENYSDTKEFNSPDDYFEYTSKLDNRLFDENIVEKLSENSHLEKWVNEFGLDKIKKELLILIQPRSKSKDELLKDVKPALRLEWLISLYCYGILKDNIKKIVPKYIINADGQPTKHANGESANNSGVDAIIYENNSFFTLEPTLLTKTRQYEKESFSNKKHLLRELKNNPGKKGYCLQISPEPSFETIEYAREEKRRDDINLIPISIEDFVKKTEELKSLKSLI